MTQTKDPGQTIDFGFRTVARTEKQGLVRNVFDSVAGRYDLMNDLMSAGTHRLWKDSLIHTLRPHAHETFLDVAGGTGDIAFRIANAAPGAQITVSDINEAMLAEGRRRADKRGLDLDWVTANAETLPFPDASFNAYTIAFGIRNVTDRMAALREARRVLKPGGRFLCLEFSQLAIKPLDRLYERYSFAVIPRIGQMIAGDRESYQYLVESIRQFPGPDQFAGMMRDAGFAHARYRRMTGGVVALHSGRKL
ncbi:2-octaprenyl-6-methoxy-1,4-benzoquinone methylase /demethylmenaquinone methyltransferase [Rhodothalassium salexigens DSM 2132]|uniref:Ubiquinone/menaquinone biosynthesis C-methyltransferase UbiE n=1 Tax=Rhodothalassium salexigens DSM 2132 TaxID=1188247 RepID=A0A4R2PL24_RHOSA|nr:bifunctional demethylmenaquinone methyltransferase/2-methoxy-6-polyprenyl-1,4-benzoquinol methylase UbiE [Rhodothalassium salexigens]MBB4211064.1 demethylmenaquinone methyltransferase/2-methoxy-6-polyprenyl-1,4-benzoquinol methylase [Rhodothalassium salexigens DSM 2132]MBK1637933.1 bifunctional demethylmenaquinone methyltransferase/2-methoxy-6-polyprenyl-1,4-benzoquinol methylase [Rhodothalassium salexigens DSM 2132]TCP36280.1 2-octaprenyl-6-methoxy-1,4-benzoquinone methylase /demethylmenaqui